MLAILSHLLQGIKRSIAKRKKKNPITLREHSNNLIDLIKVLNKDNKDIIVYCIGSAKVEGDSVGPKVGSLLSTLNVPAIVVGTLDEPMTAVSIKDMLKRYPSDGKFAISIDASLSGKKKSKGTITIKDGGINPGSALGKTISPIGDISVYGNVIEVDFEDKNLNITDELKKIDPNEISELSIRIAYIVGRSIKEYDEYKNKRAATAATNDSNE